MKRLRTELDQKPLTPEEEQEFNRLSRLDRLSLKERKRLMILGAFYEIER